MGVAPTHYPQRVCIMSCTLFGAKFTNICSHFVCTLARKGIFRVFFYCSCSPVEFTCRCVQYELVGISAPRSHGAVINQEVTVVVQSRRHQPSDTVTPRQQRRHQDNRVRGVFQGRCLRHEDLAFISKLELVNLSDEIASLSACKRVRLSVFFSGWHSSDLFTCFALRVCRAQVVFACPLCGIANVFQRLSVFCNSLSPSDIRHDAWRADCAVGGEW